MPTAGFAPILIAYLLGVATPIVVALLFFRGQDSERENSCLLVWLLVIILVLILAIIFLWVKGIM